MSIAYTCPSCGQEHLSRLQGRDQRWLEIFMDSCGEILEPCPTTGRWVRVVPSTTRWIPTHDSWGAALSHPAGAAHSPGA